MEGDHVVCYYSTKEKPMSYAGIHQYAKSVGYYNSYINIRVVVMIKKKKKTTTLQNRSQKPNRILKNKK